jgi:hypothetical protein
LRTYRQRRGLQREVRYIVSDAGLTGENVNGRMTTPWGDYHRWKEGPQSFLLYLSNDLFHVIPKRFFGSKSDVVAFREMLRARLRSR